MRTVMLADKVRWPALGLGTWRLGESRAQRITDVAVVREALDIGYRLIDTAEMYGEGGAEQVVGAATSAAMRAGLHRDEVVVVSKFYPHHAEPAALRRACDRSRVRLGLDVIDLYLLHWRGPTPLAQTVDTLESLRAAGWIRHWGVSNFDADDMLELMSVPGGPNCAANQVHFSLGARGVGFDLLPWQQDRRMPLMAYSPLDQGDLAASEALRFLASQAGMEASDVALAWVLSQPGVIAIPKAARRDHLLANWRAAGLRLDDAVVRRLDELYPAPTCRHPLSIR